MKTDFSERRMNHKKRRKLLIKNYIFFDAV